MSRFVETEQNNGRSFTAARRVSRPFLCQTTLDILLDAESSVSMGAWKVYPGVHAAASECQSMRSAQVKRADKELLSSGGARHHICGRFNGKAQASEHVSGKEEITSL
jgi:hypothetical protein